MKKKMTFALCFCNRGFMPGELIYGARDDMVKAVTDAGYDYIMMDKELTRYGGVETRDEGLLYAKWLKEHEGQYDGVIFSMPIFADENGAITALQDAGVPILMQAYPDEIGKMDFAHRRDAYCGKFSVTDHIGVCFFAAAAARQQRAHHQHGHQQAQHFRRLFHRGSSPFF